METQDYVKLVHFLGYGMLFTAGVAGWILGQQYNKAADYKEKSVILRASRPVGLLGPIGILIMLITGIGNMHARSLGVFTENWLTLKILFFAIASINGVFFGIRAAKRGKMVGQLAEGTAPSGTEGKVKSMDTQFRIFYIAQIVLMLLILTLSIVKPGRGM